MTLYEQLSHLVDLRISGFEKSVPPGAFLQASFTDRSAQGWFDELTDRCRSAIGKTYLPVFRLSDGEFYFSVGYRVPRPEPGSRAVLHYLRHAVSYVKYGKHRRFWSGTPGYGYETYAGREWTSLREKYIACPARDRRGGPVGRGHRQNPEPLLRALPSAGLRLVRAPPDSFDAGQLLSVSFRVCAAERPAAVPGSCKAAGCWWSPR